MSVVDEVVPPARHAPVTTDERTWLSALSDALWHHREHDRLGPWSSLKRELTEPEVWRLWKMACRHRLPCVMINTDFGFRVGMAIYDHAPYPDLPTEHLISISARHLPGAESETGPRGERFPREFAYFARFTHSERNRQLLAYYGLPSSRDMSYYDY